MTKVYSLLIQHDLAGLLLQKQGRQIFCDILRVDGLEQELVH